MVQEGLTDFEEIELRLRKKGKSNIKKRMELRGLRFKETKTARLGNLLNKLAAARKQQLAIGKALGRPKGSYDKRYKQFGGVYGYRKQLAQALRMQRLQQQRDLSLTPEQQFLLRQAEIRKRANLINPENRAIPDTSGIVSMGSYQDEILNASNIVP